MIPPILDFLRRWAARGTAVVIVEQQIDSALAVADRAIIMERGETRLSGIAAELKHNARLHDIYLGLDDEGEAARHG